MKDNIFLCHSPTISTYYKVTFLSDLQLILRKVVESVHQFSLANLGTSSDLHLVTGGNLTLLESHFVSLGETSAYVTILAKERKEHLSLESSTEEREGISRHITSNLTSTLSGNI